MFYSVTGEIIFMDENSVAVDCNGVGFRCSTTLNTLKQLGPVGSKITLLTHLNVREDSFDLFGFFDKRELDCFKLLISVTGVGPKAALAILSQLKPEKLALCVATGDIKTITGAQGVGTKLAQRVVLELKDKLKLALPGGIGSAEAEAAGIASESGPSGEAVSALVMLGYSQSEASVVVSRLDSSLTTEQLIRQALKSLARQ
ncbi:MAG: Holliday junction branch migration protein RuvA [Eubacteriales bacterium]